MNTVFFLIAVTLAAVPPRFLLFNQERLVDSHTFDNVRFANRERKTRRWWKSSFLYVDPIRGALATWLLAHCAPDYLLEALPPRGVALLTPAILAGAIALQACWTFRDNKIVFPVGFIAGCTLAALPPIVALGALVVSISTALATRTLPLMAVVAFAFTAAMCVLLLGRGVQPLAFSALWLIPFVLSLPPTKLMVIPLRF